MSQSIQQLVAKLQSSGENVEFSEVIDVIASNYKFTSTAFRNGELMNVSGTNEGSCKIFTFAKLHNLSEQETLNCFGQYYREDVLNFPLNNDHGNIRNFMKTGWSGISFDEVALTVSK